MPEVDPELYQLPYLHLLLCNDFGQAVAHGTREEEIKGLANTLIQLRLTAYQSGMETGEEEREEEREEVGR